MENGVEVEGSSERVCGRVMAKRSFGKLAFLSLQDERGSVQLFCDKKRLEETSPGAFEMITELIDVGDIIGVRGSVKRSDKGELSIVPAQVQMLTKALLPLPDKWHGLTDVEKRWLVYQLLVAVDQCHARGVCHGDLKSENVMVTSWTWATATDLASYKPT